MSTYGRNFEYRVQPIQGQRQSGYIIGADYIDIPFGAPVTVDFNAALSPESELRVVLAAGTASPPRAGKTGLAFYEWSYEAFYGTDPDLTTFSDKGEAPAGKAVYLVSGKQIVFELRNTATNNFPNYGATMRTYPGRTMVAGLGATPTLTKGALLRPHDTPNDTNGYWTSTVTPADAWLEVLRVDVERQSVEVQFLY